MEKRIYKNHRLNTRDQIYNEIKNTHLNKERSMTVKKLSNCVKYFDQQGIYNYQNFIETLKKIGFRAADIKNCIVEFLVYIKSQKNNDDDCILDWINYRFISKSNSNEKNLILNFLAHKYPNDLLYFTQKFIQNKFPILTYVDIFFNEFQEKIQKLHSSSINIESKNGINNDLNSNIVNNDDVNTICIRNVDDDINVINASKNFLDNEINLMLNDI